VTVANGEAAEPSPRLSLPRTLHTCSVVIAVASAAAAISDAAVMHKSRSKGVLNVDVLSHMIMVKANCSTMLASAAPETKARLQSQSIDG
jgi:hypothetical protein